MLERIVWRKGEFKNYKTDKPVNAAPIGEPILLVFEEQDFFALPWTERPAAVEAKIKRIANSMRLDANAYCIDHGTCHMTLNGKMFYYATQLYQTKETN